MDNVILVLFSTQILGLHLEKSRGEHGIEFGGLDICLKRGILIG